MDVLIIEDEPLAALHLSALIEECDPNMKAIEVLDSIKSAVFWLKFNEHPPLIFMDIHLGDGNCFEIFNQVKVSSFIIFTTAYDQYALNAFKVNSIDYLLKPLSKKPLWDALIKFKDIYTQKDIQPSTTDFSKLIDAIQNKKPDFKERFVVKVGSHIRIVKTDEIACYYSLEKATYLVTKAGKQYLVDFTLEGLLELLDPAKFFRVSRQCIVEIESIVDVLHLGSSRVKVKVVGYQEDVVVSRDKIKSFKHWLEG